MKWWVWLLVACAPSLGLTDTLQFEIGSGGAFASYAKVEIRNQQGQLLYSGSSDGYGRVSPLLPAGDYKVIVATRAGIKSSTVRLSNANVVDTVIL
jgi:hypothetical protein